MGDNISLIQADTLYPCSPSPGDTNIGDPCLQGAQVKLRKEIYSAGLEGNYQEQRCVSCAPGSHQRREGFMLLGSREGFPIWVLKSVFTRR